MDFAVGLVLYSIDGYLDFVTNKQRERNCLGGVIADEMELEIRCVRVCVCGVRCEMGRRLRSPPNTQTQTQTQHQSFRL